VVKNDVLAFRKKYVTVLILKPSSSGLEILFEDGGHPGIEYNIGDIAYLFGIEVLPHDRT